MFRVAVSSVENGRICGRACPHPRNESMQSSARPDIPSVRQLCDCFSVPQFFARGSSPRRLSCTGMRELLAPFLSTSDFPLNFYLALPIPVKKTYESGGTKNPTCALLTKVLGFSSQRLVLRCAGMDYIQFHFIGNSCPTYTLQMQTLEESL